jgi:hypothetical protein
MRVPSEKHDVGVDVGVDVVLIGENKNLAYLSGASDELIDEFGDVKVTTRGCILMGSPVGRAEFRAESLVKTIKGKFTKFYEMLKLIPIKQHMLKLNRICGGKSLTIYCELYNQRSGICTLMTVVAWPRVQWNLRLPL